MKHQQLYDIIYWGKRNGDTADMIYKKILKYHHVYEKATLKEIIKLELDKK